MEPGTFLTTLARLWEQAGVLLWALATACLVAFAGIVAGDWAGVPGGAEGLSIVAAWLLPLGLALLVLAIFRTVHDRAKTRVRFVARSGAFASVNRQKDGSVTTQIGARFEALNTTEAPIYLPEVRLVAPTVRGPRFIMKEISTKQPDGDLYGRYAIEAHHAGHVAINCIVRGNLVGERAFIDLKFKASDQFGRWHFAEVRHVPIRSK